MKPEWVALMAAKLKLPKYKTLVYSTSWMFSASYIFGLICSLSRCFMNIGHVLVLSLLYLTHTFHLLASFLMLTIPSKFCLYSINYLLSSYLRILKKLSVLLIVHKLYTYSFSRTECSQEQMQITNLIVWDCHVPTSLGYTVSHFTSQQRGKNATSLVEVSTASYQEFS